MDANMVFSGCQGKPKIEIFEKKCPNCGAEIEIFSVDVKADCPNCGFTIYNDALHCVEWCRYARECVGEKMYEQLLQIAENRRAMAGRKEG